MNTITAEAGLHFYVSIDSGSQVYKVVGWKSSDHGDMLPLGIMIARYENETQEWELHSTSASAYTYENEGRPFTHFVTYFVCRDGLEQVYRNINDIAKRWGHKLIEL